MQLIISSRHCEVSDGLRQLVEDRFSRLGRYDERINRVEVTLLEEKNRCEVQGDLSIDGRAGVHAHAEAPEFRTAVDRVVEKLARQLKKSRSRFRNHKGVDKEGLLASENLRPSEEPSA